MIDPEDKEQIKSLIESYVHYNLKLIKDGVINRNVMRNELKKILFNQTPDVKTQRVEKEVVVINEENPFEKTITMCEKVDELEISFSYISEYDAYNNPVYKADVLKFKL